LAVEFDNIEDPIAILSPVQEGITTRRVKEGLF
jgi:hypothetical protein